MIVDFHGGYIQVVPMIASYPGGIQYMSYNQWGGAFTMASGLAKQTMVTKVICFYSSKYSMTQHSSKTQVCT